MRTVKNSTKHVILGFDPRIYLPLAAVLLFFAGYFFWLQRADDARQSRQNEQNSQRKDTPQTGQYSFGESQGSFDTVIIQKDESESIIGAPVSPPSQAFSEEVAPPEKFQKKELFPVVLGTVTLRLERADNEYAQTHGLIGRSSLPKDEGMLYIVTKRQEFSYWAKGMYFATDVIWIGPDFRIVDISKNITPESYPDSVFRSREPARYVIEVNAGVADTARIQIGDSINLSDILKK